MDRKITLPCMCANVRRASRVLTQVYGEAMRALGLTMPQFSILQALSLTGPKAQGDLAAFLALDSTTLTRAVQLLRQRGWVRAIKGKDQRERWLSLSKSGEAKLAQSQPAWNAVQNEVRRKLGEDRWTLLMKLSTEVSNLPVEPANRSEDADTEL